MVADVLGGQIRRGPAEVTCADRVSPAVKSQGRYRMFFVLFLHKLCFINGMEYKTSLKINKRELHAIEMDLTEKNWNARSQTQK